MMDSEHATTLPAGLEHTLVGFPDGEADAAAATIFTIIRQYGTVLPLGSLAGVTIAADYAATVASIDRGEMFAGCSSLLPTNNQIGRGVAMAIPVHLEGRHCSHIVFGPEMVALVQAAWSNDDCLAMLLSIITHELGHVVDYHNKRQLLGLHTEAEIFSDALARYLWSISGHLWDEYYANRVSASLTERGIQDRELFLAAKKSFCRNIEMARCRYHIGELGFGDYLTHIQELIRLLMTGLGYLLGASDAQEKDLDTELEEVTKGDGLPDLRPFHLVLKNLWRRRGKWLDYGEFLALNAPTLEFLEDLRIYPHLVDGRVRIEVPVDAQQVQQFMRSRTDD